MHLNIIELALQYLYESLKLESLCKFEICNVTLILWMQILMDFFPFEEDFKRLDKFYVNGTVSKWSFVH